MSFTGKGGKDSKAVAAQDLPLNLLFIMWSSMPHLFLPGIQL